MIRKGTDVEWNWGNGTATGTVVESTPESVSHTIDGSTVTRHGTRENPALLIEQEDGQRVLKLRSEVSRVDR